MYLYAPAELIALLCLTLSLMAFGAGYLLSRRTSHSDTQPISDKEEQEWMYQASQTLDQYRMELSRVRHELEQTQKALSENLTKLEERERQIHTAEEQLTRHEQAQAEGEQALAWERQVLEQRKLTQIQKERELQSRAQQLEAAERELQHRAAALKSQAEKIQHDAEAFKEHPRLQQSQLVLPLEPEEPQKASAQKPEPQVLTPTAGKAAPRPAPKAPETPPKELFRRLRFLKDTPEYQALSRDLQRPERQGQCCLCGQPCGAGQIQLTGSFRAHWRCYQPLCQSLSRESPSLSRFKSLPEADRRRICQFLFIQLHWPLQSPPAEESSPGRQTNERKRSLLSVAMANHCLVAVKLYKDDLRRPLILRPLELSSDGWSFSAIDEGSSQHCDISLFNVRRIRVLTGTAPAFVQRPGESARPILGQPAIKR